MSDIPMKAIIEVGTNNVRYVPFTPEEIQQRELDAIAHATAQAEAQAEADRIEAVKSSARAKLIAGETLTAEEAALLI